jgi:Flp pilus assembly protein TadG
MNTRKIPGPLKSRFRSTSGQSLIESALVFPILIFFLVGSFELARVARVSISVANAAKAGAQYAAQNGFTANDSSGIQTAASAEAPNLSVTATTSYACVCSDGSSSTCLNTDCSSSHMEETVTVNTQATVNPLFHLPGLPTTWTVKGKAVQRCLQ